MTAAAYTRRKDRKSDEEGSAMSVTKGVFVLIHGGWHNHSAWDSVTPILKANGFAALTLDLPGAGVNAIAPTSLRRSPFDPAAIGATRINVGSTDEAYRSLLKAAFYGDVSERHAVGLDT